MNEELIKNLKKLAMMTLKAEEEALLKRPSKDLSDSDIKMLIPLSRYKHWLKMAQECIVDILHYDECMKKAFITPYQAANLQYLIDGQYKTMQLYLRRANCCRQNYYKVRKLQNAPKANDSKATAAPDKKKAA